MAKITFVVYFAYDESTDGGNGLCRKCFATIEKIIKKGKRHSKTEKKTNKSENLPRICRENLTD